MIIVYNKWYFEWFFFTLPVYMTLLMTVWCKSKFTMSCKHVIVYCAWHVWLQSTMTAWDHTLKVSMSCIFFIYFILHAYLVCIMTIYITTLALHFILLNTINLYYDRSYTSTANNDSLIFSMVLVSICWCFDSSSSDVCLSFSWLFKSFLVSVIIFFITDLTYNVPLSVKVFHQIRVCLWRINP